MIIPYQEIIGNYSNGSVGVLVCLIIPYQEIIGNYSPCTVSSLSGIIIPYQEIIGNYSYYGSDGILEELYHTKK